MRNIFEKLGLSPHRPPQVNDYHVRNADRKEGIHNAETDAREEAGRQTEAWFKAEDADALEKFAARHTDIRDNLHRVAKKAGAYARILRARQERTH